MARRYVFNDEDLPDDPPAQAPAVRRRTSALEQLAQQQRDVNDANALLQVMRQNPAEFIRQVRQLLDQEDAIKRAAGPYDDQFYAGIQRSNEPQIRPNLPSPNQLQNIDAVLKSVYEPAIQEAVDKARALTSTVRISGAQIAASKDEQGAFAKAIKAELQSIAEGARREEERRMLEQERQWVLYDPEKGEWVDREAERMQVSGGGTTLVLDRATLEQYRQLLEADKRYEPPQPGMIYTSIDELAPLPEPKYLYDPSKAQVEFMDRKAEDDRVLRRLQMAEEQRLRALELLRTQRRRSRSP